MEDIIYCVTNCGSKLYLTTLVKFENILSIIFCYIIQLHNLIAL